MEREAAQNMVKRMKQQQNIYIILLGASIMANILFGIVAFTRTETIILIPSNITEEVRIQGGYVSSSYIKGLATDVIEKFLNITSHDYNRKADDLLHMASARYVHSLEDILLERKKSYEADKIATYFIIKEIQIDGMKAIIEGKLETKYDKEIMESEPQTYEITFTREGNKQAKLDQITLR